MKPILLLLFAGALAALPAQALTDLPVAIGAGTVEVWNDSLYFFGGSRDWGGRNQLYPQVYKFDGTAWSLHDTIPDNNVWGVASVLVGDEVYLLGGWRLGATSVRKYNLIGRTWTSLAPSPNPVAWGSVVEHANGFIFLINNNGSVFAYDIAGNTWSAKTPNSLPAYAALSSLMWQGEIYLLGFYDSAFYKYSPSNDTWTRLADTPYPVAASAMGEIGGRLYCAGGSAQGNNSTSYRTILAYDPAANSWTVDQQLISGRRTWMSAAHYQDAFYILGGFDTLGVAVNTVERIMPLGPVSGVGDPGMVSAAFSLEQNYPNPFNPSTVIRYQLAANSTVSLEIHNLSGQRVRTLVSGHVSAGQHEVVWDGRNNAGRTVAGGVYFCRLQSGGFVQQRKLVMIR